MSVIDAVEKTVNNKNLVVMDLQKVLIDVTLNEPREVVMEKLKKLIDGAMLITKPLTE